MITVPSSGTHSRSDASYIDKKTVSYYYDDGNN